MNVAVILAVIVFAMLMAAGGLAIAAVQLLVGLPWALLTGAAVLAGLAALVRLGLPHA